MDADEAQRDLEERLAALDARLRRIEGQLGFRQLPPATGPAPVAPAAPQPPPPTAPAIAQPSPSAPAPQQTYWSADARAAASKPPASGAWANVPDAARPSRSLSASLGDLEARLTGRALAWVGGIALVLGLIFFLGLAFNRGWIGPSARVAIGLVAGLVAIASGAAFLERRNRLLGHVLTPVGLAAITISLVGATRLYDLIPIGLGLAVALASATAVALIAIRSDSMIVAGFGLISVLVAPPLLNAPSDAATLAYVGAVLLGTTVVSIWRTWAWLPAVAFVLAAPQAAVWIGGRPEPVLALVGVGIFWVLNTIAAAGEEVRRYRNDLSASSATLLLANAAFLVWAGFAILEGGLASWQGAFLLLAAMGHGVVGLAFIVRDGERNLFGLLALGTAIALLTMAAPAQLGAPMVPVAWTAEAVALTWLAVRRAHPYSALVAAVLYVLAAADLILVHGRADDLGAALILDGETVALAFFAAGVAVGVGILSDRSLRSILAALGILTSAWSLALRLDGLPIVLTLAVLTVVGVAMMRLLPALPEARTRWRTEGMLPASMADIEDLRPVFDNAIGGAVVITGAGAATMLALDPDAALGYGWGVVLAWCALAIAGLWMTRVDPPGGLPYRLGALVGLAAASVGVVVAVAPPRRLVVEAPGIDPLVAIQSAVAMAALIAGLALLAALTPTRPWRTVAWSSAGIVLFYLLSVAAVDVVATQVGSGLTLEELATQGQVALSVTWAGVGVVAFVAGLRRRTVMLRQAGLGMLGLATAKVFAFDLASLEIAYRVISFIALGLLLLASAWVWQRLQPREPAADESAT